MTYGRVFRVHTGGAESHISGHILIKSFAQVQLAALFLQLQHFSIQFFPGCTVAAVDDGTILQQQTHQRAIADTQAQNGHPLPFQRGKILFKS